MTTTREKLLPALIDKIPVLVESETKEGGKKTVTHEYVNSDKRFTEELGKLPPKFTLNVVVHGDDSIDSRKKLEDKLDAPGLITITHPVYGEIQVKSTTYTVSSNQRSIGEFRYIINFETSEATITAEPLIVSTAKVTKDADGCRDALDNGLEDKYKPPTEPSTLDKIAAKADEIYNETFGALSAVTETIQDKVSTFQKGVNNARAKIKTIVQQPALIKAALKDLYATGLAIVNTPADLMDAWKSLTDFGFVKLNISIGSTDTVGIGTNSASVDTVLRIEEDVNKNVLDEHTRLTALVNFYEAAAYNDFQTNDDILEVRKSLDDTYRNLIENLEVGPTGETLTDAQKAQYKPLAIDPTVRNAIQTLRTSANQVLNQKSQSAWRVETIRSPQTSIFLTAYKYYGDIDQIDTLRELNSGVNSSNVTGNIKVISK